MPRLFVALPLSGAVTARLADLSEPSEGVRWVPPNRMHLTLRFLGPVDDAALPPLLEALDAVAAAPFSLHVRGPGVFPNARRPRVLWVGAGGAALPGLHEAVRDRLAPLFPDAPPAAFHPHVTLARLKPPAAAWARDFLHRHAGFDAGMSPVTAFHLYASTLRPGGPVYTPVASFPLRAP